MLILNVYNKLNDVSLIFKNDRIMRAGIFGYLQIFSYETKVVEIKNMVEIYPIYHRITKNNIPKR